VTEKQTNEHTRALILALAASGLIMGLTPAPQNLWPLAWAAAIPLWVAVIRPTHQSKLISHILLPSVWGICYHGVALFWMTGIHPLTWMGVPWLASLGIAFFTWGLITLWGAATVTLWGATSIFWHRCHPLPRLLIATAVWCGVESLWSASTLWWTALAYTQSPGNLAGLHLGQLAGPNTVNAAIMAVNGLLAQAWINRRELTAKFPVLAAIGLFICCQMAGLWLYSRPLNDTANTALKIGIIQGNIPNQIKFASEGWRRALEGYTTGYRELAAQGVDAVLIPETALPYIWTEPNQQSISFYRAILENGVTAFVGTFGTKDNSLTNSLFSVNGRGETISRYDKIHLVPLGEYIPFEKYLGKIINRLSPLDAHLVRGEKNQVFETPFGKAIAGICFDSAFAEHFRRQAATGGEFILSAANDAHYAADMMAQHHALDLMRAIEVDRWAVRATNTGLSAIINPHGETKWLSQINTYELHADTIYRRTTETLYVRWGDWLTPLLGCLGIASLIITRIIGLR